MASAAAPLKKRGLSKKTKKGWRKNTDILEIEEYLEDKRLEERLGGAFDARADDELFTLETNIPKEEEKVLFLESPLQEGARAARKRKAAETPLRCFQNLQLKMGVADPKQGGRNKRTIPEEYAERRQKFLRQKNPDLYAKKIEKKRKMLSVKKKNREALLAAKAAAQGERQTRRRTKFDFDLWNVNEAMMEENEWMSTETKLLHNLGKQNTAKMFREKTSDLPVVKLPDGGASYNPSYKDHQELLRKATVIQIKKDKAKRKIEHHTDGKFPLVEDAPTEASKLKEMSEGLTMEMNAVAADDSDNEAPKKSVYKKKTKVQRNKEKRLRGEAKSRDSILAVKIKEQDLMRLRSLRREITAMEKLTVVRMAKKQQQKMDKRLKPATLSAYKFEEPELEVKLSDELTGQLRNLTPEGNLLEDRYKSLQERNVIETRVVQKVVRNKRKRKVVQKRSHKMGFPWENK